MQHVQNIQYVYLLNKYLKCSVWRLALRYDIYIYIYMSLGFKRLIDEYELWGLKLNIKKTKHMAIGNTSRDLQLEDGKGQ